MSTTPLATHCVPCEASCGYTAPGDACFSYQTLYKALADFEADLHQHIHLENNIFVPTRSCDGKGALAAPDLFRTIERLRSRMRSIWLAV